MSEQKLSADDLIARAMALLEAGDVPEVPIESEPPPPEVNGYEEAAAVLGWFDPGTLRPTAVTTDSRDLDALTLEATEVIDDHQAVKWSIPSNRRVQVLRHLREGAGLERAFSANAAAKGDVLHQLIRTLATGGSMDVRRQSLADLYSLALVCDWLGQAGFGGLPDPTDLQDQIDRLALLEPLELLAGHEFVGRKVELGRLHAFVDADGAERASRPNGSDSASTERHEGRMMVLYGPGGIGKSTLVAKFLLQLADRPPLSRVPFAYLDFDRPSVEGSHQCLALLSEVIAQLGVQFPRARVSCRRIREDWAKAVEVPRGNRRFKLARAIDEMATLLQQLDLDSRRLVLVLDTFEVVQYRSSEEVAAILRMIDLLVERLPKTRVIVAGRAGIPRRYAEQLEVAGLDLASARSLLVRLGVKDRKLADRIARRYCGDPVSLKLAAADPDAHQPLNNLISRAAEWFFQLDGAVIQRRLYDRVLGHVSDPEVRKVAQSGLTLRRLTPDIVLRVLAKPCGLDVATLSDAERVCEELKRETSLVQVDPHGALLHRPELRRVTLALQEADQPVLSQVLHRAAIAYYAARTPDPRERAEEIYHRLKVGEDTRTISTRWLAGVEVSLESAVDELDGPQRAFLASRLGRSIDISATHEAQLEDYERLTARKARVMLDDERPRDALTALSVRRGRTVRSPLVSLTAEAHFALGQVDQALSVLGNAADEALIAGVTDQTYQLTRLQAELVVSAGAWEQADPVLRRFRQLETHVSDPLARLACSAFSAVITQRTSPAESVTFRDRARSMLDALGDETLVADGALLRLVGSLFDCGDHVRQISRVVRLAGIPRHLEGPVRVVAAELARTDVAVSARDGAQPGVLARRYRLRRSPSLTAAWSAFLLGAHDNDVRSAVCGVLDIADLDFSPLVTALARLMGTDPTLRRSAEQRAEPEPDVVAQVSLPPAEHQMLTGALTSTFTPTSLRWFLRLRLHQSLDALVPGDQQDFSATVSRLVTALQERGLLLELIARAREVAPGDLRLLRAADAVGLETPLTGALDEIERRAAAAGVDTQVWLRSLGELEGQICRVSFGVDIHRTGFLVGADLVLTSAARGELVTPDAVRCRFDAKESRHGDLVTPGICYDVIEQVASGEVHSALGGWALLRVAGSPGVQPIGGDNVESATGTLRGWIDLSGTLSGRQPDQLLLVSPGQHNGTVRLVTGEVRPWSERSERSFRFELPTSDVSRGAPIYSRELVPVGMLLSAESDGDRCVGLGIPLAQVVQELNEQGRDHLVRTVFL